MVCLEKVWFAARGFMVLIVAFFKMDIEDFKISGSLLLIRFLDHSNSLSKMKSEIPFVYRHLQEAARN